MKKKLSHIDKSGLPSMVDVSKKKITTRTAQAQAKVLLTSKILNALHEGELITKKGPVFQTAIIAGVMAAKKTSELIPLCHPLLTEDCQIKIVKSKSGVIINSFVKVTAKTGAEMEALTAVTVAALTIYDMCKALSHDIIIEEIKLISKTGGKNDFNRK
ncbi:MAG TPA: cyclic pyranopterin monophosphate synthase MoaC [Cytophagales bacterium]|jgi:cyclic pyranopterin monophosphate synthase|nr:cyclic pyranopterin monophosphate synthase MoaC [Cytophagales bacterium]